MLLKACDNLKIKSVPHTFNSHGSIGTNGCLNKAIHVLLMYRFGSLYAQAITFTTADPFMALNYGQSFRFFSRLVGQSDPWSKKWGVIF